MQETAKTIAQGNDSPPRSTADVEHPPCEVGLSVREWVVAGVILAAALAAVSPAWRAIEPLDPGGNYRIPYAQGDDYWLFERYSRTAVERGGTLVLGDSVVWGHFVPADGTLSSRMAALDPPRRYWNLGVDGIHPAALAGLVEHFGGAIRGRDVILHCNLLWMSSPRYDLQAVKGQGFGLNHPRLMPQFWPGIPAYDESVENRLTAAIGREAPPFLWARHIEGAYFGGQDIPAWTLEHPYRNPLGAVTLRGSQGEPGLPEGAGEQNWIEKGVARFSPQWVDLETSIQWRSFREAVERLLDRGNRVLVVVGPLNEHMLKWDVLLGYLQRVAAAEAWLKARGVPCFVPAVLPSEEYADASHPLRAGYDRLARGLLASEAFHAWARK